MQELIIGVAGSLLAAAIVWFLSAGRAHLPGNYLNRPGRWQQVSLPTEEPDHEIRRVDLLRFFALRRYLFGQASRIEPADERNWRYHYIARVHDPVIHGIYWRADIRPGAYKFGTFSLKRQEDETWKGVFTRIPSRNLSEGEFVNVPLLWEPARD